MFGISGTTLVVSCTFQLYLEDPADFQLYSITSLAFVPGKP